MEGKREEERNERNGQFRHLTSLDSSPAPPVFKTHQAQVQRVKEGRITSGDGRFKNFSRKNSGRSEKNIGRQCC